MCKPRLPLYHYSERKRTKRFSTNKWSAIQLLSTSFYEKISKSKECIQSFPDKVSLPKLNENQTIQWEGATTESEILKTLPSIENDKSLGNDGITK